MERGDGALRVPLPALAGDCLGEAILLTGELALLVGGDSGLERGKGIGADAVASDTDVSYLPDLRTYLDDLLRQREKLRSMAEADDWARAEAMPSDAEITRIRRLIQRVTEDVEILTEAERAEIQQAAQVVRQMRQNFLGMPRIRQPLPDLRPERPA